MSENTSTTEEDQTDQPEQDTKDRLNEFSSAIDRIRDESETNDDSCGC